MIYRIVSRIDDSLNGPWKELVNPALEAVIQPHLTASIYKGFIRLFPRNNNLYDVQNPQSGNNIIAKGVDLSCISNTQEWALDFKEKLWTSEPMTWRIKVG